MTTQAKDILNLTKPRKILVPIILGLGVASYLLIRNFDANAFSKINWTWNSTLWILLSLVMVVIRDWAYMIRIRVLTNNQLTWKKSFDVIMLWEFCSAIIPPVLGGGFAFAIYILIKEKISMGRSISVILFSSFLDGMFFALIAPIVYFTLGHDLLFGVIEQGDAAQLSYGLGLAYFFWIVYFVVLAYKILVAYALFINATAVKIFLMKVFSIGFLKKWKVRATKTGMEMEIAALELKQQNKWYWIKSFVATCVSWSARFIIINCIIKAFSTVDFSHYVVYARQVVMGIINIASPTPGGAGLAEWLFGKLLGEFLPSATLALTLAMIWRLISYYPYLFVGAIVIPRWVKRVFTKQEIESES